LATENSYKNLTDKELVQKIVKGNDPVLFGRLYDRYVTVVYNKCHGFSKSQDEAEDLTQDVFLTDLKYGNDACALRYSKVNNYWEVVTRNHRLAYADAELIIRHLVLPNNVECCTRPVLEWIARNLGSTARTNIMPQFRPEYKAREFEELRRRTTADEMDAALKIAREVGLENVIS